MVPVLTAIAGLLLGFAAGFLYRKSIAATNAQSIETRAQKMLLDAEREAGRRLEESARRGEGRDCDPQTRGG